MLSATPPRPLCRRSELVHDWKARLGCDAGEGVGRSQSVIVVRDDLGVLKIFANQFESKAETAHKICGLAQKWQIRDCMGPPTLRYQGLDGADWMGPPTLRSQGNVDGPFVPFVRVEDPETHTDWMGPPTLRSQGNVDGPSSKRNVDGPSSPLVIASLRKTNSNLEERRWPIEPWHRWQRVVWACEGG